MLKQDDETYICVNCGWASISGQGFLVDMQDDVTSPDTGEGED